MDYDRIILEMLDRIKALEDDVAELKGETQVNKIESNLLKMPSKKYRNLSAMLVEAGGKPVSMTFSEIEELLGFELPSSAREHRAFWANTESHSIARSWLDVGYRTMVVDLSGEKIVFEK